MTMIELPRVPGVPGALWRAASTRNRPPAAAGLPDVEVLVRGVRTPVEGLAAYDRLCGFPLRDTLPATWLHVLTFPLQAWVMARPDFPFPLAGILHLGNAMVVERAVATGVPLDLRVHAADPRPHRKGVVFDLVGEAAVAGETVWRGVSTYLTTARTLPGDAEPTAHLRLPDAPVSQQWRLPPDLGRRYAAVSGDYNPIHLHPLTARPFGLPRPIIHGMWTHARALAGLAGALPERYGVRVQFAAPLRLPGRVGFAVAGDAATTRFAVLARDGRPHLVGELEPR